MYSDKVGQQLMRATGRMEMCAGWLASDSGRHDVARSCYNEALSLARQAGDPEIETHALANLAFLSNALGQPREALRFAVAAERTASTPGSIRAHPRTRALYRVRLAQARFDAGAVDGAAEAANAALDDLTGEIASWRVASELNTVVTSLAAYPHVVGVDRVLTRYAALERSTRGSQDSGEQLL